MTTDRHVHLISFKKCVHDIISPSLPPLLHPLPSPLPPILSLHRCATTCLIMVLCVFYPQYMFWLQLIVTLDICSHWIQMYSSLIHGDTSHKVTDLSANPIMRLYYTRVSVELYTTKL